MGKTERERQTDRETDRQRQTDRQTDREREKERERKRDRDRQRGSIITSYETSLNKCRSKMFLPVLRVWRSCDRLG